MGRYTFILATVYSKVGVIFQHLRAPDSNDELREYCISNLLGSVSVDDKSLYVSALWRDGRMYHGVSPEDGVAEVLLGERRVSHQPH